MATLQQESQTKDPTYPPRANCRWHSGARQPRTGSAKVVREQSGEELPNERQPRAGSSPGRRSSCSAAARESASRRLSKHGPRAPRSSSPAATRNASSSAARELGALSSAAFDATDFKRLRRFFDELPKPIDHMMVTAGGPVLRAAGGHRLHPGAAQTSRRILAAAPRRPLRRRQMRPGGTLLFIGGIGGRRPAAGPFITTFTAASPALTKASRSSSHPSAST